MSRPRSRWWRGNYSKCNSSHRTFAPRSGTWQIIVWTVPTGPITVNDGGKEGGGHVKWWSHPPCSDCVALTSSFAAINMTREEYCRLAEVGFWVILSLHSFSIIELLHPTMWWRCTIRFIWTSAHPESKGLILTDLNELATPLKN